MIRGFKRWDVAISYAIVGESIRSIARRSGISHATPMRVAFSIGMLPHGVSKQAKLRAQGSDREREIIKAARRVALDQLWKRRPELLDGKRSVGRPPRIARVGERVLDKDLLKN